jgi:hypothetical protein
MIENRGDQTEDGLRHTDDTDESLRDLGARDGDDVESLSTVGDSRPCYEPDSILS